MFLILFVVLISGCYPSDHSLEEKVVDDEGITQVTLDENEQNALKKHLDDNEKLINEHIYFIVDKNHNFKTLFMTSAKENNIPKLRIFLKNEIGDVKELPVFYGNQWVFSSVVSVTYADYNNDQLKDLLIIGKSMTGIGKNGAQPFDVGSIYFQQDEEFSANKTIEDTMNERLDEMSPENIQVFLKTLEDQ